jgi:hypothetical protein
MADFRKYISLEIGSGILLTYRYRENSKSHSIFGFLGLLEIM